MNEFARTTRAAESSYKQYSKAENLLCRDNGAGQEKNFTYYLEFPEHISM